MKVNLMTWNTRLYEYGNIIDQQKKKPVKPIDVIRDNAVLEVIKDHIDKKENAIAVLQEIPLRSNITNREHEIFTLICDTFPEKDYTILYNVNETVRNQIKMTVVISKKNFVKKDEDGINSNNKDYCNCFVSFMVGELKILAVHQSLRKDGFIEDKIKDTNYNPDIIIGDFNAGDYNKSNETKEFQENREKYRDLIKKYTDKVKKVTSINNTEIDHILVKDGLNLKNESCYVDDNNILSDHYPIYYSFEIEYCEKYLDAEEYPVDKEKYPYAYECTKCGRVVKNEEMYAIPDMCDECRNG